ncbi:hypothetical protein BHQ23_00015 [Mycobacterium gordonae]|uniref:Uncharacterized protein n=1 Tax=Mycobacterium gordonae TaxID=1778 RepID=A0A1A6BG79_MYCGO|nr:hypothetical protein A9W98_20930 [Mycobacterium gordonae]ODR24434.1 hypothetical protein BHQ23_00015 [Mycobacterium gordonae]ORV93988.1 hypothetical protein AWC08_17300 [Mycobacterium gordonae]
MVVDGLDLGWLWRHSAGRHRREGVADASYGSGDVTGHVLIEYDQLSCTLPDFVGKGLPLGLTGHALRGRPAPGAVGDRQVFANIESGGTGILDRVTYP